VHLVGFIIRKETKVLYCYNNHHSLLTYHSMLYLLLHLVYDLFTLLMVYLTIPSAVHITPFNDEKLLNT